MNLDFIQRHAQPFSIAQARQLDVATLTTEVSRLEHSLGYLNQTQSDLKEALADGHDQDLTDALRENEEVIASQKERIRMLELVLLENGVNIRSTHTRQQPDELAQVAVPHPQASTATRVEPPSNRTQSLEGVEMDEGVYL